MATFAGLGFEVLNEPQQVTTGGPATVTKIPGGNVSYIDLSGPEVSRLRLQLWLPDSSLSLMRSLVGSKNLLTFAMGTTQAVLLSAQENKREYWSGDALHLPGWYLPVDAEFLIV